MVYHYTQAGNKEKSIEYGLIAGKEALSSFSNTEAIKHFTYVTKSISDSNEYKDENLTALEGLGDAFFAAGKFEAAGKIFERLSDSADSNIIRLRALRKAMLCSYWIGDNERSLKIADKAKEYSSFDNLENARLQLYRGFIDGRLGKNADAIDNMEESLRVFEENNSVQDIARSLVELCFIYPSTGRLEDSLDAALRSVALYEALGDLRESGFALGRLGSAFLQCGFFEEALNNYSKAIKIGEKVGDYNKMAFNFFMLGIALESTGNNRAAIAQSLKGLDCAEKTDANYAKSLCYANLIREYARLEEIECAEAVGKKLEKLFNEAPTLKNSKVAVDNYWYSKAFLHSLKGQWKAANLIFEKRLESHSKNLPLSVSEIGLRVDYAWSLLKQGQTEEAEIQQKEAQKIRKKIKKRFEQTHIKAHLILPKKIGNEQKFNIWLDLVNIGENPVTIIRVRDLIPSGFKVLVQSSYYHEKKGSLEMNGGKLGVFSIESLKLILQSIKTGTFYSNPKLIYQDNNGEIHTLKMKPFIIIVEDTSPPAGREKPTNVSIPNHVDNQIPEPKKPIIQINEDDQSTFEFKTYIAQKAFNFLIDAFIEDYMLRRITQEKAGWRTLMEVVRFGKLTKFSVYGPEGRSGKAISELENRGLVEARFFPGERGRGGKIMKLRVCYEKEILKKQIDNVIVKRKNK